MGERIRVAMVCHFSNSQIRERVRFCWRGPGGDTAIWNTELINAFEQRDDIELHVIAPMYRMKGLTQTLQIGKVHYYFYQPGVPFLNISWRRLGRLDARTNYWWARHCVQGWIKKINPDIVNLIGAENPHYSMSIWGLKGYPILVSMQSVYSNPDRFKLVKEDKERSRFERMVIAENKYFGINAPQMPELIRRDVKDPVLFWNRFPTPGGSKTESSQFNVHCEKVYDFVQFSGLTELKGAPDTIRATAIVKKAFPNVKVRMMGGITPEYLSELKGLIRELGLEDNITLTQGFAKHADLMSEAGKARYYVLPTKIDTIPTTIFEATHLGLPVVSYKTGDIPLLNTGDERVLLADRLDVGGLARQMLRLMKDPKLGRELNQKAQEFTGLYFSNEANVKQFVELYRGVIERCRFGTDIPKFLFYEGFLMRKGSNQ